MAKRTWLTSEELDGAKLVGRLTKKPKVASGAPARAKKYTGSTVNEITWETIKEARRWLEDGLEFPVWQRGTGSYDYLYDYVYEGVVNPVVQVDGSDPCFFEGDPVPVNEQTAAETTFEVPPTSDELDALRPINGVRPVAWEAAADAALPKRPEFNEQGTWVGEELGIASKGISNPFRDGQDTTRLETGDIPVPQDEIPGEWVKDTSWPSDSPFYDRVAERPSIPVDPDKGTVGNKVPGSILPDPQFTDLAYEEEDFEDPFGLVDNAAFYENCQCPKGYHDDESIEDHPTLNEVDRQETQTWQADQRAKQFVYALDYIDALDHSKSEPEFARGVKFYPVDGIGTPTEEELRRWERSIALEDAIYGSLDNDDDNLETWSKRTRENAQARHDQKTQDLIDTVNEARNPPEQPEDEEVTEDWLQLLSLIFNPLQVLFGTEDEEGRLPFEGLENLFTGPLTEWSDFKFDKEWKDKLGITLPDTDDTPEPTDTQLLFEALEQLEQYIPRDAIVLVGHKNVDKAYLWDGLGTWEEVPLTILGTVLA